MVNYIHDIHTPKNSYLAAISEKQIIVVHETKEPTNFQKVLLYPRVL